MAVDMSLDLVLRSLTAARTTLPAHCEGRVIFVAVDLGRQECHSAFVVVERIEEKPTELMDILRGVGVRIRYVIRQAERMALGTPYTEVVKRVKSVVGQLAATRGRVVLVVDESGVGAPVVEAMRAAGMECSLYAIVISSGQQATAKSVPRVELLTKMKMMVERGELELAAGCLHGEQLKRELVHLKLSGGGAGDGGERDDLALALA